MTENDTKYLVELIKQQIEQGNRSCDAMRDIRNTENAEFWQGYVNGLELVKRVLRDAGISFS